MPRTEYPIINGLEIHVCDASEVENTYHTGKGPSRDVPLEKRKIIAWDGEGMKLSGDDKPQHYVLFGCSADIENPMIGRKLQTLDILDYIIKIGERYPRAVHVGYGFRYDMNMIIQTLSIPDKAILKLENQVTIRPASRPGVKYRIEWLPGKSFSVTKRWGRGKRDATTVTIDDVVSFFACPFIEAVESILSGQLTEYEREVVEHGKSARADNLWEDMPEVRRYWEAEIQLMQRMVERFREVMFNAGFKLTRWYGPGALASYVIRTKGLKEHIQNRPFEDAVHQASKHAYAGGRFELFQVGRIQGPVYGYDINSAYPYALSNAPSLGKDHGEWVYVYKPTRISEFGVYRIRYMHGGKPAVFEYRAMPLFHRDNRGAISFPNRLEGWYWSPEAAVAMSIGNRYGGVEIVEGWEWHHDGTYPFKFMEEMFNKRMELGKKNVISMPYKLGPNSMYGKLAQRVGWKTDKDGKAQPPMSHCLPLAGWITSKCRASLMKAIMQIPMDRLIAVETDGIYTTQAPRDMALEFGDGLGQWGVDNYDEMLYLQNGIYHRREGRIWLPPKSRGLDIASVSQPVVEQYLRELSPGDFPPLTVDMRERFVGLSAAMVGYKGQFSVGRVKERHCRWERGKRDVEPGGSGKRMHVPRLCPACNAGATAWDAPHPLVIRSRAGIAAPLMSAPHHLPWENLPVPEVTDKARKSAEIERDMFV
jgi:hypothetical protein